MFSWLISLQSIVPILKLHWVNKMFKFKSFIVLFTALVNVPLFAQEVFCQNSVHSQASAVITLFVSEQGDDCGDGSLQSPFKSLYGAQQAVRTLISNNANTHGINVEFLSGNYTISSGVNFTSLDSGQESAPIIYKAANGAVVTFFGGKILDSDNFNPLMDSTLKNSLVDASAASHILEYDLSADGITDFGTLAPHGFALEHSSRLPVSMLYNANNKMTLARWPNPEQNSEYLDSEVKAKGHTGMVSYVSVIDEGPTVAGVDRFNDFNFNNNGGTFSVAFDRMKYWQTPSDVFLDGILAKSWQWTYNQIKSVDLTDKTITLKRGELDGIGANKGSYFFFENIVEEIDSAGEFYIDRSKGKLYFYPPENFSDGITVISTLEQPMISVDGGQHISFVGLHFDTGRHLGVRVTNSNHIYFTQCSIRNFSLGGIALDGMNNEVNNCVINNLGGEGVKLSGGIGAQLTKADGSTVFNKLKLPVLLTQGNNKALNNTIYNVAWDQKSQVPGINIEGVGNSAIGNEIFDAPHFAVLMRKSTKNTVSFNYIYDLPKYHKDDGGALYVGTGNFPHMRGNEVSNNYFVDIPTNGVYIDNFSSGVNVERNIFNNVGFRNNTFSAININGGGHNLMKNNFFYDVERPMKYNKFAVNNVLENYIDKIKGVQHAFNDVGVDNTPYTVFDDFKEFLKFKSDQDYAQQPNTSKDNLLINANVSIDMEAQTTGVWHPPTYRWTDTGNLVYEQVLAKDTSTLEDLLLITKLTPDSDDWRAVVEQGSNTLPDIIETLKLTPSDSIVTAHAILFGATENNSQLFAGQEITLNGSASTDSMGNPLTYRWEQTLGDKIAIKNANTAIASFVVPKLTYDQSIAFSLTVTNNNDISEVTFITAEIIADEEEAPSVEKEKEEENSSPGGALSYLFVLLIARFLNLIAIKNKDDLCFK